MATPRGDDATEQLAVAIDGTFVASTATYERMLADFAGFPPLFHGLSPIPEPSKSFVPRRITVWFEPSVWPEVQSGTYSDWDCLNDLYEMVEVEFLPASNRFVRLHFDGVYDSARLAAQYAELRGVAGAEPSYWTTSWWYWVTRGGGVYHYFLRSGYGDCPAGCIHQDIDYLVSSRPGVVQHVGTWFDGDPEPTWIELLMTAQRGDRLGPSNGVGIPTLGRSQLVLMSLVLCLVSLRCFRQPQV